MGAATSTRAEQPPALRDYADAHGLAYLWEGTDGRHSGTVPSFRYSEANKNSGIVWDEAQFLDYIKNPKAKIPGTIMVYPYALRTRKSAGLIMNAGRT